MARIVQQGIIQVAGSGETGVQVNEFEAAIKSVTSSATVGAVFLYDTRSDSDSGAWRKKCAGLSWFDEAASATRSARSEFPSVALIVGDIGGANTVTIYDLDDPSMPMWMVFNAHTAAWETNAAFISTSSLTSVYALNGRMYVGGEYGLVEIDFITEQQTNFRPISSTQRVRHKKSGAIVDRNDTSGQFRITATPIANTNVNDVSATIVEGAEIGALGLPIPTIAVACNSPGASVIHPNGNVYNFTVGSYNTNAVAWDKDGLLIQFVNGTQRRVDRVPFGSLYTNTTVSSSTVIYNLTNSGWSASDGMALGLSQGSLITAGEKTVAQGGTSGLQIVKRQSGNDSGTGENLAAHITSSYNTGYMLGDIRGAFLMGDRTADRSVKGNTLTLNQASGSDTVDAEKVDGASGTADLFGYKSFSADNYLSKSHTSDFDFGTGDFSIMFWVKYSSASGGEYLFARDTTSGSSNKIALYVGGSNFTVYAGTETDVSALDVDDGQWHQIGLVRTNGKLYTLENGKYGASGVDSTSSVTNGLAVLHIGQYTSGSSPAANASISLFRISKTAPTPQQVKDMYEAEAPLFRAGAKCLLDYSSTVGDLAYDKGTDLLYVTTKVAGVAGSGNIFRGLESIDTLNSNPTFGHSVANKILSNITAANGVVAVGSEAHAGVNLPAIDVRGDINTADTKLPDDGKLHFSGVTTDATVTTIGQIPVAEGESYMVRAVISGNQYQDQDGERILVTTERTFYRDIGGNILARSDTMKLTDETTSSMDAILSYNTSPPAHNILIKVTGIASTPITRMQWNATVEVQRITERSYER